MNASRSVARIITDTLSEHGCDSIFYLPGRSTVSFVEALRAAGHPRLVTCRHESNAALMAIGDSRLTKRPGVCLVGRGPGATNAALAMHMASEDNVPLILIVGHVPHRDVGRGAFQEVDYGRFYGAIAKKVLLLLEPSQASSMVAHAVHIATHGTPGPVVLTVPDDIQDAEVSVTNVKALPAVPALPAPTTVDQAAKLLGRSKRPLLIAGELLDTPAGRESLLACARAHHLGIVAACMRQDLCPNDDPAYMGVLTFLVPPAWRARLRESDLVLAVGTRFDDATVGRHVGEVFPSSPIPEQPLIHVHPDANKLNQCHFAHLAIGADPAAFLDLLAKQPAETNVRDRAWFEGTHNMFLENARQYAAPPEEGVDFGLVVRSLLEQMDDDAIITLDAGNFATWVHRHWVVQKDQRLLASTNGAMGFGVPAAVAAALRHPKRQVIGFAGDGGFMMTGAELLTALHWEAPVLVVISHNATFASVRAIQERRFPGKEFGTYLLNPDFSKLAESYGATAFRIQHSEEIRDVVSQALHASRNTVVVLETMTRNDRLSAYMRLESVPTSN